MFEGQWKSCVSFGQGGHATEETRNAYEYVIDLRNRIESTCRLAEENLATATQTYKKHFDKS